MQPVLQCTINYHLLDQINHFFLPSASRLSCNEQLTTISQIKQIIFSFLRQVHSNLLLAALFQHSSDPAVDHVRLSQQLCKEREVEANIQRGIPMFSHYVVYGQKVFLRRGKARTLLLIKLPSSRKKSSHSIAFILFQYIPFNLLGTLLHPY